LESDVCMVWNTSYAVEVAEASMASQSTISKNHGIKISIASFSDGVSKSFKCKG